MNRNHEPDKPRKGRLPEIHVPRQVEGLIVLILIGLGRNIMKRTPLPVSAYFQSLDMSEKVDEPDDAIKELPENPLGYLRLMNEKVASELETQLRNTRRNPIETDSKYAFSGFGVLIEVIGMEALRKLKGDSVDDLTALFEGLVEKSWEEAPLTTREEIGMIIRLLSFFSANINT